MQVSTENTIISVLLVEDNEDHALLTMDSLEESGIESQVKHLSNGQLAIEYLCNCPPEELPDVVLLDIKMPLK
ncbi:MAG: hypothetical protein OXT67_02515, partial [Zetaproteobacteria bacterium]|nr:hypothetical protein [Zetaproteobacteria bacterium]